MYSLQLKNLRFASVVLECQVQTTHPRLVRLQGGNARFYHLLDPPPRPNELNQYTITINEVCVCVTASLRHCVITSLHHYVTASLRHSDTTTAIMVSLGLVFVQHMVAVLIEIRSTSRRWG